MNLGELERKLIAAARSRPPSEAVPYAFAKRIMTLISLRPPVDPWFLWSRGLWRAVAPCAGVMVVLSAWTLLAPASNGSGTDLSQEFEKTVLAAVSLEQPGDSGW